MSADTFISAGILSFSFFIFPLIVCLSAKASKTKEALSIFIRCLTNKFY